MLLFRPGSTGYPRFLDSFSAGLCTVPMTRIPSVFLLFFTGYAHGFPTEYQQRGASRFSSTFSCEFR